MKKQKRYIGIVGTRRRIMMVDRKAVWLAFIKLQKKLKKKGFEVIIVSGGCHAGADSFAEEIAEKLKVKIIIHKIRRDKMKLDKNGKPKKFEFTKQAYARNKLIALNSHYLIACVSRDRTGGTENTIEHFLKHKNEKRLILC